ncbi:MAG TPA: coproporphyrinogen III oxidase, partial [Flavisolibacter sp.]|nr:coproporphyrinogen III oxidase [Flavisolibacter sp.]
IDLIYGSPLLTDEMWQINVAKALDMGVPHLSCYALTVEEKTPLFKLISQNKKVNIDSDKQARQFLVLMDWLKEKGFEHYEVSNFAIPGFRSRHNSSYWKGDKYLGIGPSAHSFNGVERRWNVANNLLYANAPDSKREVEVLTRTQSLNEYIMISLRTMEGMDLSYINSIWGVDTGSMIGKKLVNYINSNLVKMNNNFVRLTNEGFLLADGIASDLFEVG